MSQNEIWVLGEAKQSGALAGTAAELTGKARELAMSLYEATGAPHRVTAVLLLDAEKAEKEEKKAAGREAAEALGACGADRAILVASPGLPLDRARAAKVLAHLIGREEAQRPKIVLAAATAFGRAVMPYAAALAGTGLTADCTGLDIEPESGLLLQTRPAIGGNIMATIKTPARSPQMATVRPRTFRPPAPLPGRRCSVEEPALPPELLRPTAKTISFAPFPDEGGGIQDRDVIVSGGRGLRRPEGFALLSKLAALLGGGVGASRPAVEMKWIAYPHQVGLSGQTVSPKLYIAAGISGAVQHLAGMQTAEKIVAVNRDPDAPIFRVSDIALCGDLCEILPMLMKKIQERRGRA